MSKLEKLRNEVVINIKSILLSSKDGCTEKELLKQYQISQGHRIPFQQLGYNALEDFLNDLTHCIQKVNKYGKLVVYRAIVDESNERLRKLVDGQVDRSEESRESYRRKEAVDNRLYELHKEKIRIVPPEIQNQIIQVLSDCNEPLSKLKIVSKLFEQFCYQINPHDYEFNDLLELFQSLKHIIDVHVGSENSNDFLVSLKRNEKISSKVDSNLVSKKDTVLEVLFNIIKAHSTSQRGVIDIANLSREYKKMTNDKIPFKRYGYQSISHFLRDNFGSRIKFTCVGQAEFLSVNDDSPQIDNEMIINDENNNNNTFTFAELANKIRYAFKENSNKFFTLDEFLREYRFRMREDINHKRYGCESLDKLLSKLATLGICVLRPTQKKIEIKVVFENDATKEPAKENILKTIQELSENKSNESEDCQKQQQQEYTEAKLDEFVKNECFYEDLFDEKEILIDVDLSKSFDVEVSACPNPYEMYLHLWPKCDKLEQLMENLEITYNKCIGNSFDMPERYMKKGKICAAIYPGDKNWHRCRIVKVYREDEVTHLRFIRVSFIDYGGEADVLKSDVKFLKKYHGNFLPIQAIRVRLADVKPLDGKIWHANISNYLVKISNDEDNRLKIFSCFAVGTIDNILTVVLWQQKLNTNYKVCVNTSIIIEKDGMAKMADEDSRLKPFDLHIYLKN